MGEFIWHQWSRFVAISASICKFVLLLLSISELIPEFSRPHLGGILGFILPQVFLGLHRRRPHEHGNSERNYVRVTVYAHRFFH